MSWRATYFFAPFIIYFWTLFLVAVPFLAFGEVICRVLVATASAIQSKKDNIFCKIIEMDYKILCSILRG